MLPGPVFNFELMATARRSRFYLIRAFYAGVLFVILWGVHAVWTSETDGDLTTQMVPWFAFSTFCAITIGQEILVLLLTPALVAGVIADEKQRKTLHYLMASQLTSAEIVLGKLLVRMLYVTVLLGVSLPVLSLLVLMGGIDPRLVLLSVGATLSTGWFLASLSIWVSTIAKRVREAFFIAFGLECLWLFSPFILRSVIAISVWPTLTEAAHWLSEWLGASSPIEVARELFFSTVMTRGMGTKSEVSTIVWMIGLQTAFGCVLSLVAAWQLRPIFRRQGSEGETRAKWTRFLGRKGRIQRELAANAARPLTQKIPPASIRQSRRRLWHRPILGERPMLWKELYTGRPSRFARLVGFVLMVIGGGLLAYNIYWLASLAIHEIWEYGSNAPRTNYLAWGHRIAFLWFVRGVVPLIYLISILGVTGAAAAAFTSEHEEDTWISLTATDLTGREIVFAKMIGAMRRGCLFGGVIVFLAVLGAALGSINPLSIPLLVLALVIYASIAAALGLWISLQLRSTWRAQFLTVACLLLINVLGQGMLNMLSKFGYAPQLWPGFTPYETSKLVLDSHFSEDLSNTHWPSSWSVSSMDNSLFWHIFFSVLSMLAYSALSAILIWHILHRFEIVAGRARRATTQPPNPPTFRNPEKSTLTTNRYKIVDDTA
jgi:ABC-type transport system involved in multi-copper enzyme maturation permease subunit